MRYTVTHYAGKWVILDTAIVVNVMLLSILCNNIPLSMTKPSYMLQQQMCFKSLHLVLSVPCLARNIKAEVDCYSQVALVDWQASDGALLYEVMATAASGHNVTCETNSSHCELEGLLCGQRYSVSVKAAGHTCSSVGSMEKEMLTGNRGHPSMISTSLTKSISLYDN